MLFWILAIALTAIACTALYYASVQGTVNQAAAGVEAVKSHFRLQLREIDTDVAAGRMGAAEAVAARGELAREVLKLEAEGAPAQPAGGRLGGVALLAASAVAVLALGTYWQLGRPELPAQPLATRPLSTLANMTLEDAVRQIEAHLATTPGDLRGWATIAPAYRELGRYDDAVKAYRQVNALAPPTADSETDLGEAVMLAQGGSLEGEPLALFRSAAARDPAHVRSRFYLASEATHAGRYGEAVGLWDALIGHSTGDEPWLTAAREGREAAIAGRDGKAPEAPAIRDMVEGLSARLAAQGGSIEEWTQLVRSRLVLGETGKAQAAYDAARTAYPDAAARQALDVLAADHGLVAREATP